MESSFTAENIQINGVANTGIWINPSTDATVEVSNAEINAVSGGDEDDGIRIQGGIEIELASITVRNANKGIILVNAEQESPGKNISFSDIELSDLKYEGMFIYPTTGSDHVEVTNATVSGAPEIGFGVNGAEGMDRIIIEETVTGNSGTELYFGSIEEAQVNRVDAESLYGDRFALEGTSCDDVTTVNSFGISPAVKVVLREKPNRLRARITTVDSTAVTTEQLTPATVSVPALTSVGHLQDWVVLAIC